MDTSVAENMAPKEKIVPNLKDLQLPTLQEAADLLAANLKHREELRDLLALYEKTILKVKAQARASASVEFYLKYGEWDWDVRQRYMEHVKSMAYESYDNKTAGFVFDLWDVRPHGYNPDIPFSPTTIISEEPLLRCVTEFVPPDKVGQCKISPLVLEAFELLQYAPGRVPRMPRIDRQIRQWVNVSGFDAEGYKWHLEGVPPPLE